ncbi:Hypothetical predicted protein [Paramuricea clavata]|uniref:Uncharacterized protein n=1 Tax=Paramuricea clavata TaxID=317549 RepID=A0A7D9LKN6_PARCT|nr:Hypothetical predicted protein [Paramuricea clavata]
MDLALNVFPETAEQIQSSSSDHLREMSDSAESKVNQQVDAKQFKINIPQIEEDFPDRATKKTKIFPLPISHENQCKTVGVASNLDLFAEAYERFAFLKSLEQHQKQQRQCESILRGETEKLGESTYDTESAEVLTTVEDDLSSDCEED